MSEQNRRKFIKAGSLALAAGVTGAFASCTTEKSPIETPNINFNNNYQWKMVTTWPPNFPVLGQGCKLLAKWVEQMSGGRLKIEVYGGGELIPSLECFDAVSHGAVEMMSGSGYYWAGKIPAATFFSSIPFGVSAQQMNTWILNAGGQKLWEEIYAPFNLIPLPGGNTGQQAGGWYNKEINTIEDYKGLKIRMPGIGGKVINKVGGTSVLVAGGELFTNLERGVIDATEWIGPYHDYKMGFHRVAKHYYFPGWHEPGTVLEMAMNKDKYNELPKDLQEILYAAIMRLNQWMLLEFDAQNAIYLQKMIDEGVDIRAFSPEVLAPLRQASKEVITEMIDTDSQSKKVYEHFQAYRKKAEVWSKVSEGKGASSFKV
ncbi:TRAP-type mannitol/chloroaromatic compound transport system, substrate-binding protein [Reichenbachiella agariperforans]|uniref:TRAP-type mannitol/chloroaromatic compound transport system, substrate-binding protein n=1 Tax=Reichenbachiella agariperforans TaxID=156994 RepID=A0A1M6TJC7_REIAG|nr:TRAP transporter substrate-binding protein [Reichenbachiella agariperforans]SHK57085.1 TRAP-type mannitol/chloroaromatic compound transport system, substrate-binding protein [Reichenbachiella agariperforans]